MITEEIKKRNTKLVIRYLAVVALLTITGCGKATGVKIGGDDPIAQAKISKMEAEMNGIKEAIANISVQFKASLESIAKINSDTQTQTAGRDISTTNDTAIFTDMNKTWYAVFVILIGLMKWESVRTDKKNKQMIAILEAQKADYRNRYLAVGIKNEEELKQFRSDHVLIKEKIIKTS